MENLQPIHYPATPEPIMPTPVPPVIDNNQ